MPTARSLHIGLNAVDSDKYPADKDGNPWVGTLEGAEADAKVMVALAEGQKVSTDSLLTGEATIEGVSSALIDAAESLHSGDYFLLTFAGHGGSDHDDSSDEPDALDESWALYDGLLLDDELHKLLSGFEAGVHVLIVSDSCHSGSIARLNFLTRARDPLEPIARDTTPRSMPVEVFRGALTQAEKRARATRRRSVSRPAKTKASVLVLAACEDDETTGDGPNGVFTAALRDTWEKGRFSGSHQEFRDAIARRLSRQNPVLDTDDNDDPLFLAERPFTPRGATGVVTSPAVPGGKPGETPASVPPDATRVVPFHFLPVLAAVLLAIVAIWILSEINKGVPTPPLAADAEPATITAWVGAFLIRWGLVIAVVAFVPFLVMEFLGRFRYPGETTRGGAGRGPEIVSADFWDKTLTNIKDLMKTPAGIGISMIVLGSVLLFASLTSEAIAAGAADLEESPAPSTSDQPSPETSDSASPETSQPASVEPS